MVLRRLVSLIVSVWVCLVAALRLVLGRGKAAPEPAKVSWRRGGTPGGEGEGDQATWEDWDSFSVHVVPSDGEPRPPAPPLDGEEPAAHEVDLFQDMQPVIKKAKKVRTLTRHYGNDGYAISGGGLICRWVGSADPCRIVSRSLQPARCRHRGSPFHYRLHLPAGESPAGISITARLREEAAAVSLTLIVISVAISLGCPRFTFLQTVQSCMHGLVRATNLPVTLKSEN